MSEFKWTDELVKEFMKDFVIHPNWKTFGDDWIEEFKASKQPKPEWEILEDASGKKGDPNFSAITRNHPHWEYTHYPIHSVKRLSDGEVFTVGDRVGYGFDGTPNQFFIESFHIYDKWMAVRGGGVEAVDITLLNRSAGDVCPLTPNEIKQLRKILYCK